MVPCIKATFAQQRKKKIHTKCSVWLLSGEGSCKESDTSEERVEQVEDVEVFNDKQA